jgi:putative phosphoesterase
MLIAVIADTHLPRGSRRLPDACVERLRTSDLILHAGDFSVRSAFDEIVSLGPPVAAVHGNVDEESLRRELPERRLVAAGAARIGMVHDAGPRKGRLERLRVAFPDADAVVFGHSHLPLHEESEGFQIFNPGSPTERRRAPTRSMGLARVDGPSIRFELIELP